MAQMDKFLEAMMKVGAESFVLTEEQEPKFYDGNTYKVAYAKKLERGVILKLIAETVDSEECKRCLEDAENFTYTYSFGDENFQADIVFEEVGLRAVFARQTESE